MIKEIEEKENISIVQSSLIGSKGWGYADEDSDTDFRFVYARDLKDYLGINKHEDTITYPIDNKEDIAGYDISKFMNLICNQNPVAYEIIHSPAQEMDNVISKRIREFSDKIFDKDRMIFIYRRMITSRINELKNKNENNLKLYIYILRMLGTINYIKSNNKFPNCSIEEVFSIEENNRLKELIEEAIEQKQKGNKEVVVTNEMIEFLNEELSKTKDVTIKEKSDEYNNRMLNEANCIIYDAVVFTHRVFVGRRMAYIDFEENEEQPKIVK